MQPIEDLSQLPPSVRLTLAKLNLKLAKQWAHTTPSARQARINECHREIDESLSAMGY